MNNDLISREAVFDWLCESADIDGCVDLPKNNGSCKKGCRHCISGIELDEIPTADVRENVHARFVSKIVEKTDWKGRMQSYYQPNTCSNCNVALTGEENFCPNCGAEMKGEYNG